MLAARSVVMRKFNLGQKVKVVKRNNVRDGQVGHILYFVDDDTQFVAFEKTDSGNNISYTGSLYSANELQRVNHA